MRQAADVDEEKSSNFRFFFLVFLRFTINNANTIPHNFHYLQNALNSFATPQILFFTIENRSSMKSIKNFLAIYS